MIEVSVPGFGEIGVEHLVLDYNGTLAVDGVLLPGVAEMLDEIAQTVDVHVVTADTFGCVKNEMAGINCKISVIPSGGQDEAKLNYVKNLGPESVAAIGNGRNDALMLKASRLGIAVILKEGASPAALKSADIVCTDIIAALSLLTHPGRLTATVRT